MEAASYENYLQLCSTKKFQRKKQTHLKKLNPIINAEGLMRARGRLIRPKDLSFAQKHPLILDSQHHVKVSSQVKQSKLHSLFVSHSNRNCKTLKLFWAILRPKKL